MDAEFDDAIRRGRENAIVIELSRRHCQRMEYFEAGGRGMLEAATGLPINMRRVRCPKANGTMGGANLETVAVAFYKEHCIGCDLRAPTGQLPTLSTLVEEQDAAEDAEERAEAERLSRAQAEWEARAQRRRSQAVGADPALVSVIDDLERLDPRPGSTGSDASSAALRRLMALADRAPQTYSEKAVGLMLELLDADAGNGLLGPLRVLARGRVELRDPLVKRALASLADFADPDAARVLVQFSDLLSPSQLTARVVHSLVEAAVGLQTDSIGHLGPNRSSDPAALLLAAQVAPDTLTLVLSEMLPGPQPDTSLLLPAGSRPHPLPGRHSARDRGTAAAALDQLVLTHAKLAAQLTDALIRNAMIPGDGYDTFPDRRVSQTLARFLAENLGGARNKLEAAGASASDEQRERLFRGWQSVAGLLEPDSDERIGGDQALSEAWRNSARESLFSVCMGMVGGAWGHDVAFQAAETVERLAERSPQWVSSRIDSLLGGALTALQAQLQVSSSSLVTPADSNPVVASMEAEGRRISFRSAAQRLLRAVEACAVSDPTTAVRSLADCIRFEREEDLEVELRWWLLPVIGEVAARHGSHGGVLPIVLPILYTYLVDSSPALRARAITAWASVARRHTLPATLEDLLPILLADNHVIVATALYESIPVLRLSPTNELKVLGSAVELCLKLPRGEHDDLVKALISTIRTLARRLPDSPSAIELVALDRASDLDGYDLARVLDGWWSSEARQSGQMARLRLRQVGDPQINDRFNRRDDELVVSLLEVGPGLADLSLDELTSVALSFGPEAALAGLQIVEVAWRAGRVADATVIAQRLTANLPSTQAFEAQRRFTALVEMALQEDRECEPPVTTRPSDEDDGSFARLSSQLQLRRRARSLLRADAAGSLLEHQSRMNERADALAKVARQLEKSSRRATPTAAYVRVYAALCHVASALVRLDAALQEGTKDDIKAYRGSVKRLVKALAKEVTSSFGDNDPLTTELTASIATVQSAVKRGEIPALLAKWAKLSIPLVIVEGSPTSRRKPSRNQPAESSPPAPIAVVLVSIDGRLMTGPAVLRPNTVYELGVEVQPDEWPKWAERLELELVGPVGASEIQLPTMSWLRPSERVQQLEAAGTLVVRFGLPAGRPAPGFAVHLRWHGQIDGTEQVQVLDVAGHGQIRLRPYDSSRDAITQYSSVDERLLSLYSSLPDAGFRDDEIQAFCRFFTAICREGFRLTWDRRYRKGQRISERSFHDHLMELLLADPELEGRVERGNALGLGYLDLRHDGITAELKVERRTPVTQESAPKYMGQPTQYAAADGMRLSVLAILDMSPKTLPVGTAENYVFTLHPSHHGLDNAEAPSMVAAVVVNGSLPTPSSWSRRKTKQA